MKSGNTKKAAAAPQVRELDKGLMAALEAYRDAHALSNRELAPLLATTPTYVSRAFSGSFIGDTATFEAAVRALLTNAKKKEVKEDPLVPEHFLVVPMANFLDSVMHTQDIGVTWSAAGRGKTRGIRVWQQSNPGAVLVTAMKSLCGWRQVRDAILAQCDGKRRIKNESWNEWLERSFAGSGRLLIIDNAHLLTKSARHWLAYDWHESIGCPVALIGNDEIVPQWKSLDQHKSRVGIAYEVKATAKATDTARAMLRLHLPVAEHDAATMTLCREILKGDGSCRSLLKHLRMTKRLLSSDQYDAPAKALRAAHSLLLSDLKLSEAA